MMQKEDWIVMKVIAALLLFQAQPCSSSVKLCPGVICALLK